MRIVEKDGQFHLQGVKYFDLALSLDCGQSFRWEQDSDGFWQGAAAGRFCRVRQHKSVLIFTHTSRKEIRGFWMDYFGLTTDYPAFCQLFRADPVLRRAMDFSPGIRLLKQDPWETLCTFIISQNNNIPRIKGIVRRLCEQFGQLLAPGVYSFPSPQRLAACKLDDLEGLRCGWRAKYLLDAAQKVSSGQVDLDLIYAMNPEKGRDTLRIINGVGPKVADCVLLYAYGKYDVVPMDVWMKRVLAALYPNGFPPSMADHFGIAQQYLFHYARTHPDEVKG